MHLEPNMTLGHYRLIDKIGEGGMGVVWRALDTTLGREVAIKVLPESYVTDPDRLARFEREARLLASLSHPNIASVHGLHDQEGLRFIAMELVPGADLAQRLAHGRLEVREALQIARRIAQALEVAHESGVVHRDLKPGNVVAHDDGTVKVLDFGLAKALAPLPSGSDALRASLSPTMTSAGTFAGTILGTAAYMSPEQVRGRDIDRRADLWAFGCVLYEMLAGRKAFRGDTVSDTLAAILKEEPDWSLLLPDTPAAIRRLLRRCLTKDLSSRQSGAADARILIEEVLDGRHEDLGASALPAAPVPAASKLPWIIASAMTLIAIIAIALHLRPRIPALEHTSRRLSIAFPDHNFLVYRLIGGTAGSLAFAPDGQRLVYVGEGDDEDSVRLYVRNLDDFDPLPLSGTETGTYPVFSPDGEWIAYFRGQRLEKIPAVGGASVPLADVQATRGLSWDLPDRILYVPNMTGGVWSVAPSGGAPVQVTRPDETQRIISHRFPHMLPDGVHFLLTAKTSTVASFDDALICVASLETGETRTVLRGGMDARYVDGHLVYGRDGSLFAVPFDLQRLETAGTPFPIVHGVITSPTFGCVQYDVVDENTIAYVPGTSGDGAVQLEWTTPDGSMTPIDAAPNLYGFMDISPDGRRTLIGVARANDDLWMLDNERGAATPFLTLEGNEPWGIWSRDGRSIVYASDRLGSYDLYLMSADGGDPGEPLVTDNVNKTPFAFTADDSKLLYTRSDPKTFDDIWLVPVAGEHTPEPFLVTAADETGPDLSPEGRWIAYMSNDTGNYEVYVRPYPGPGAPIRISDAGGQFPRWSADGRTLYYRRGESLLAVPVETGPPFRTERARTLLTVPGKTIFYDTHPDGRLLLGLSEGSAERSHEVRLVRNALRQVAGGSRR